MIQSLLFAHRSPIDMPIGSRNQHWHEVTMIVPCIPVAQHAALPLVHRLLHAVGHANARIGRHAVHRIRHIGHAVAVQTKMAVTTVCHSAGGVLAVAALLVPLSDLNPEQVPLGGSPPIADGGSVTTLGPVLSPFTPVMEGSLRVNPGLAARSDSGSTIVTFPPPADLSSIGPVVLTPPLNTLPPFSPSARPIGPLLPGLSLPTSPGDFQSVPEPSSLIVFATALGVASLLARRTRRSS